MSVNVLSFLKTQTFLDYPKMRLISYLVGAFSKTTEAIRKLDSAKFFLKCEVRSQKATNIPIPKGQGMFETG